MEEMAMSYQMEEVRALDANLNSNDNDYTCMTY